MLLKAILREVYDPFKLQYFVKCMTLSSPNCKLPAAVFTEGASVA